MNPWFQIARWLGLLVVLTLPSFGWAQGRLIGSVAPAVVADPSVMPETFPAGFTAESQKRLENEVRQLGDKLQTLQQQARGAVSPDLIADVSLFHKSIVWALRYETNLSSGDVEQLIAAAKRGIQRADSLDQPMPSWAVRKGKVLRGFFSAVDGSVQPYGLIIPQNYYCQRPIRLDVVLHGSSKPVGLSELRFGRRFDEGDGASTTAPDAEFIELHPLGRVENCYRWAGETDVFEAIEAVCRNYRIDRDRIVLRGMSMGASGTWHLGLKRPDRFVAIGPYCGYVDTHRFSETPIPGFIKVGPLPWYQERGLHMLDSVDYAANAEMVPAIGAIGDQDVFFQAHVLMGQAMAREGLSMVNLISPGTGHVIDPVTHREQMRRMGEFAGKGIQHVPRHLRFVTWTLKYSRCHWLEILGLRQHYERAEFVGDVNSDGVVDVSETRNIARFALRFPSQEVQVTKVRIKGVEVKLPKPVANEGDGTLIFLEEAGRWSCRTATGRHVMQGKIPGLQGPIDDAFTSSFLCVRGTGRPWNPGVQAWAEASLHRFQYEWARYMRGDLPIKNDTELTLADIQSRNLILFGDPGSNRWIRRALPKLPLRWTPTELRLGGETVLSKDHAPIFICPNPLDGAHNHYVVLNSGHTFHEAEFAAFNYLLFPRLGDWALMNVGAMPKALGSGGAEPDETVVRAGFFDESWSIPGTVSRSLRRFGVTAARTR